MNILFTNSKGLGHGGAEVSIMQYIEELERRGHNVVIASSKEFKGIKTERIKFVEKWPFFLREFYLKRKFAELIDRYSIDLITPQDNITTVSAILAANKSSIPVLVHVRDNWFACPRSSCLRPDYSECVHCDSKRLMSCSKWYRYPLDLYKWKNIKRSWRLVDSADAKVCVSSAVKSKLAACGITHNVNVVPGARVLEEFENVEGVEEFKKRYGLRKIVVTFIGSFFYTKGVLQIFKFMPEILKSNPDVSLLLVGDGPLYGDVVRLVKENGIEKQVVLTGRIGFDKIPLCYATSDILLAPHLWSEPLGATIIEASAAGKPSVISVRGGPIDFKNEYDNIIDPEDVSLWKERVMHLIGNENARKASGKKARKNVELMSFKSYVDTIEKIHSKMFEDRKK